jgi:hypothetical protein
MSLIGVVALVLFWAAGSILIPESNKVKGAAMNGQAGKSTAGQKKAQEKTTFACNMLALNPEERKRHLEVTKQLRAAMKEDRELSDGYGFRFSSDQPTILLVSEFKDFIKAEFGMR